LSEVAPDIEGGLDSTGHRVAGHRKGPVQGTGHDLGVEPGDPFLTPVRRVAVDQGALADPNALEADLFQEVTATATRLARSGGGRIPTRHGDLPIAAAVGQDLDQDRRAHQIDALDFDLALNQGNEGNPDVE
jgi:hypothetical protein